MSNIKNIAIFASGNGTNANVLIEQEKRYCYSTKLIISSNKKAGVLDVANFHNIPSCTITKNDFLNQKSVLSILKSYNISYIVLAGWLLKIPTFLINKYPNKIINIHPSLIPKYAGKGMYGMNVHETVIKNKEKESGLTIHLVNEEYDKGKILFQAKLTINKNDTATQLANKILSLEHACFPIIVNLLCEDAFK